MAGLDNGKLDIYDFKNKKWNLIETQWGGKCAKGCVVNDEKYGNWAIIALTDGAVFCYDMDTTPSFNIFHLKDHHSHLYPTALSDITLTAKNKARVFVAYDNGSLFDFHFDPPAKKIYYANMIRGEQKVVYENLFGDECHGEYSSTLRPHFYRNNGAYYYINQLYYDTKSKILYTAIPLIIEGRYAPSGTPDLPSRVIDHKCGLGIQSFNRNNGQWVQIAPNILTPRSQ